MILSTSIPKAGTHLLASVIEKLTGIYPVTLKKLADPGTIAQIDKKHPNLVGHIRLENIQQDRGLRLSAEKRKIFILIRDPRDICNSMVAYLETSPREDHKKIAATFAGLHYEEKIKKVAEGIFIPGLDTHIAPLRQNCGGFIEIKKNYPDAKILKYEDFFVKERASIDIAELLQLDIGTVEKAIQDTLQGETRTKRKGVPSSWQQNFSEDLKNYFANTHAETIEYLGYKVDPYADEEEFSLDAKHLFTLLQQANDKRNLIAEVAYLRNWGIARQTQLMAERDHWFDIAQQLLNTEKTLKLEIEKLKPSPETSQIQLGYQLEEVKRLRKHDARRHQAEINELNIEINTLKLEKEEYEKKYKEAKIENRSDT